MWIVKVALQRPYTFIVLAILILLMGLFAIARTVGWVAQWNEMIEDPNQKIGRPRQLYTGPVKRDYVAMGQRG